MQSKSSRHSLSLSWQADQEPIVESHYELEFENPSSMWARRLFANASITENGKDPRSRPSSVLSANTNTSSSSSPTRRLPSPVRLGTYTHTAIRTSPEREKHKSREDPALLSRVSEDGNAMEFNLTHGEDQEDDRPGRSSAAITIPDQSLGMDDEEEEEEERWILDEELARQGMYRGSYRQLLCLYSLTPVFTLLVFIALACFPKIAYPLSSDTSRGVSYPYLPYFPFPFPEFITATAFWALSHLFNPPIFSFFSFILFPVPILALSLSSFTQSTITTILRQAVVPILLIPQNAFFDHPTWRDMAFRRVWWLALGWAAAEAVVGVKQGYEGIALYRDVLVSVRRVVSTPSGGKKPQNVSMSGYGAVSHDTSRRHGTLRSSGSDSVDVEQRPLLDRRPSVVSSIATQSDAQLKDAIEEEVERDLDELVALRGREELEDLYGMPFIHIPVFISCLHRLNTVLFVLGSTLFLTAAYMRSSLSSVPSHKFLRPSHDSFLDTQHDPWKKPSGNTQLLLAFTFIVVLQWVLTLLHTPRILPRIGVQTFVYVGFMISLGVFFAGLGVWEGIV